jgi:hypothetical protein
MGNAQLTTTIGLQWGIFVALGAAIGLAYAGTRLRAARRPEPAPVEDPTLRTRRPAAPAPAPAPAPARAPAPRPRPPQAAPSRPAEAAAGTEETEQLSLDDHPGDEPTRRRLHRRGPDGIPEFDPFGER